MKIETIKADTVVKMTSAMHRAFKAGGCDPICHCCYKPLAIGEKFKLASANIIPKEKIKASSNSGINVNALETETREVMLCDRCIVKKLNKKVQDGKCRYDEYRKKGGGCYRINGKIESGAGIKQ